jgi:acyl carrier protein
VSSSKDWVTAEQTTMIENQRVIQSIYKAIDEVNGQLPRKLRLKKSQDTVLYGESSKLDSLGLVMVIVATEQRIEDDFGLTLTLASEKALSMKNSPFKTVGSLAEFILTLFNETSKR